MAQFNLGVMYDHGRGVNVNYKKAFEWDEKARRLNFDFEQIALLGLRFNLPKGGAAKIGASTGLGAESNVVNARKKELPAFFNWISADEQIATARGGGGGLALWRRL